MRLLFLQERDEVSTGPGGILTDTEASSFARLEAILPPGCISWKPRALRFGPFCGVLRAGGVTIELLPKTGDAAEGARGVLVAMLRATGNLTTHRAGDSLLDQQRVHLLDQFIIDFCARVTSSLREGAIAHYQELEDNLATVRGRLAFTEHFRRNAFVHTHLFCRYDERTIDNAHNRALKAVLHCLHSSAIGTHAKATVGVLLHRFTDVTSSIVKPRDFDRLHFDRTTAKWKSTFNRAKWLLEGLFPDVRVGQVDGSCLLFNMERLFEAFIGTKLRDAHRVPGSKFQVLLQGPRLDLAVSNQGPAFELRPDISIVKGDQVTRILDAKWKNLDPTSDNLGIDRADIYQMVAYAGRYGCDSIGLVYPATQTMPAGIRVYRLLTPGNPSLSIHTVSVRELALTGAIPSELRLIDPLGSQESHGLEAA